jgi:8-oxo-dGTP diphosphatase
LATQRELGQDHGMLYLVRHGNAGNKRAWTGPDDLRPLSPRGRLQAEGLVHVLAPYPVDRILVSPTDRCRQTMRPLADARRLPIGEEPALAVNGSVELLMSLLRRPGLDGTALCTHGEVIGALFERLVADGVEVDGELRWPKGSVWVLEGLAGPSPDPMDRFGRRGPGRPTPTARYLPPSPVPD